MERQEHFHAARNAPSGELFHFLGRTIDAFCCAINKQSLYPSHGLWMLLENLSRQFGCSVQRTGIGRLCWGNLPMLPDSVSFCTCLACLLRSNFHSTHDGTQALNRPSTQMHQIWGISCIQWCAKPLSNHLSGKKHARISIKTRTANLKVTNESNNVGDSEMPVMLVDRFSPDGTFCRPRTS
jgi:hypothetical protein